MSKHVFGMGGINVYTTSFSNGGSAIPAILKRVCADYDIARLGVRRACVDEKEGPKCHKAPTKFFNARKEVFHL